MNHSLSIAQLDNDNQSDFLFQPPRYIYILEFMRSNTKVISIQNISFIWWIISLDKFGDPVQCHVNQCLCKAPEKLPVVAVALMSQSQALSLMTWITETTLCKYWISQKYIISRILILTPCKREMPSLHQQKPLSWQPKWYFVLDSFRPSKLLKRKWSTKERTWKFHYINFYTTRKINFSTLVHKYHIQANSMLLQESLSIR